MVYGTCYFPTLIDAYRYYAEQEGGHYEDSVDAKIADGEIKIGKPNLEGTLQEGCRMELRKDQGGSRRWFVVSH